MKIKELTIKEKIGQMVIVGMDTNYVTDRIRNMIQNYKIGGVILYRKNFSTYQDMLKLIKELKELNKDVYDYYTFEAWLDRFSSWKNRKWSHLL